jgi:hypothetical protein
MPAKRKRQMKDPTDGPRTSGQKAKQSEFSVFVTFFNGYNTLHVDKSARSPNHLSHQNGACACIVGLARSNVNIQVALLSVKHVLQPEYRISVDWGPQHLQVNHDSLKVSCQITLHMLNPHNPTIRRQIPSTNVMLVANQNVP